MSGERWEAEGGKQRLAGHNASQLLRGVSKTDACVCALYLSGKVLKVPRGTWTLGRGWRLLYDTSLHWAFFLYSRLAATSIRHRLDTIHTHERMNRRTDGRMNRQGIPPSHRFNLEATENERPAVTGPDSVYPDYIPLGKANGRPGVLKYIPPSPFVWDPPGRKTIVKLFPLFLPLSIHRPQIHSDGGSVYIPSRYRYGSHRQYEPALSLSQRKHTKSHHHSVNSATYVI